MTKKQLPLDPFDPQTLITKGYQIGNLALAILLVGPTVGALLIGSAEFDRELGWFQAVAGVMLIVGAAILSRRLFNST